MNQERNHNGMAAILEELAGRLDEPEDRVELFLVTL